MFPGDPVRSTRWVDATGGPADHHGPFRTADRSTGDGPAPRPREPLHRYRRPWAHLPRGLRAQRAGAAEPRHASRSGGMGRLRRLPLQRLADLRLQPHPPERHRRGRPLRRAGDAHERPVVPGPAGVPVPIQPRPRGRACRVLPCTPGRRGRGRRADRHGPRGHAPLHLSPGKGRLPGAGPGTPRCAAGVEHRASERHRGGGRTAQQLLGTRSAVVFLHALQPPSEDEARTG